MKATIYAQGKGEDDWGRKVAVWEGNTLKDVDGVWHTCSKDGEPCCPIRKDIKVVVT